MQAVAFALALYGLATVAEGSAYLAVSIAGIAEIVAFVVLGLPIDVTDLVEGNTFWIGLGLAADAGKVHNIIFVVVLVSVLAQGSFVPLAAKVCAVPMRVVEPEQFALGMRFRHEPEGLHRYIVEPGSPADDGDGPDAVFRPSIRR